jgi:hypothetical protein
MSISLITDPAPAEPEVNCAPVWPPSHADGVGIGRRYLLFIDLLIVLFTGGMVGIIFSYSLRTINGAASTPLPSEMLGFLFLLSVLVVLFINVHGLYASTWQRSFQEEVKHLGESIGCAALVLVVVLFMDKKASAVPAFAPTIVLSWLGLAGWRRFLYSQSIPGFS